MTNVETILRIRSKLLLVIFASLLIGIGAYYAYSKFFFKYKSETSFYINESVLIDMNKASMDPQDVTMYTTMEGNRVMLLLCSDELRDSIIKDFGLYEHYGLRVGEQFAHESLLLCLNRAISIKRDVSHTGLINVMVEDKDKFLAAKMANRIVERVNMLNKEIIRRDIRKKIGRYENVLASLKAQETGSRRELLTFIDSLHPMLNKITGEMETPAESKFRAMNIIGRIGENSTKYESILEEYYNMNSNFNAMGTNEWQTITINKKAYPDTDSNILKPLLQAFTASFFTFFLLISALVFFYQNENEINTFLYTISRK